LKYLFIIFLSGANHILVTLVCKIFVVVLPFFIHNFFFFFGIMPKLLKNFSIKNLQIDVQ